MPSDGKSLVIVAGTRPEVIKLAPVIEWLDRVDLEYMFVWSGQHYDYEMSRIFFEELGIPRPDVDLDVRSGSHAEQTAKIMVGLEKVINDVKPSFVVALGDTNTVVASALTSAKLQIPFAHIEAGLRSFSNVMPEEINRRVADSIASIHFAPTKLAAANLLLEGVPSKHIYVTGNTIVDVALKYHDKAEERGRELLDELDLNKHEHILVTLHRAENTDNPTRLSSILKALHELSKKFTLVFPIHPRTSKKINELGLKNYLENIKLLKPLGYFEFLGLLTYARTVLTDSGGVQEEAFTLKVPTVTLRYNTERPETTMYGINVLAGTEHDKITNLTMKQFERFDEIKKLFFTNPLGDGRAGERIAKILVQLVDEEFFKDPDLREKPSVYYHLVRVGELHNLDSDAEILACFDAGGEIVSSLYSVDATICIVKDFSRV